MYMSTYVHICKKKYVVNNKQRKKIMILYPLFLDNENKNWVRNSS